MIWCNMSWYDMICFDMNNDMTHIHVHLHMQYIVIVYRSSVHMLKIFSSTFRHNCAKIFLSGYFSLGIVEVGPSWLQQGFRVFVLVEARLWEASCWHSGSTQSRGEKNELTRLWDWQNADVSKSWKSSKNLFEAVLNDIPVHFSQVFQFMLLKSLFCSWLWCFFFWWFVHILGLLLPGSWRRTLRPGCHHWRRHEEHWRWHWCGEPPGKRTHCRWNQQGLSGRKGFASRRKFPSTSFWVRFLGSCKLMSIHYTLCPLPSFLTFSHTTCVITSALFLALTSKCFIFFHTYRPRNS